MNGFCKGRPVISKLLKRGVPSALGVLLVACAPAATPTPVPPASKAPAAVTVAPTPAAKAPAATATPSDAELTARLYEAAKKEGQVMVYTVGTSQEWDEIGATFSKKYPGIKVEAFAGTSEAIRDKILTEARAGRPVASVIARTTFDDVQTFLQPTPVLDKYLSPELKKFDKKHYDAEGLWALHSYYIDLIEYNTDQIKKEQAPKSYADLLKPEFKGKLGLEANAIPWFSYMLKIMGKEKGLDYMRKLADQKPKLVSGHTSLHRLIVSGEIPVAVYMYNFRPIVDIEKGAPIVWVDPEEVTPTGSNYTAVIKNAPHPNAGRLIADFMLSEEGANVQIGQGWLSLRQGVDFGRLAPLSKVDALISTEPSFGKEITDNEKIFREIFGKP